MDRLQPVLFLGYKFCLRLLAWLPLYKFRLTSTTHNFFLSKLKPTSVRINDCHLYLDSKDSLRLSTNPSNFLFHARIIGDYIAPGVTALDIGAHIGLYSTCLSRLVGKSGKVYAFEPNTQNFSLLKKNLKVNHCRNVIAVQKAVSNTNGTTALFLSSSSQADHRIYQTDQAGSKEIVETIRIDDFLKKQVKIRFIKIDVQGAEFAVLQSMTKLLKKNKDITLFLEYFPRCLSQYGIQPKTYIQLLTDLQFELFDISDKEQKVYPTNTRKLSRRFTLKNGMMTNLLCIRKKKFKYV